MERRRKGGRKGKEDVRNGSGNEGNEEVKKEEVGE